MSFTLLNITHIFSFTNEANVAIPRRGHYLGTSELTWDHAAAPVEDPAVSMLPAAPRRPRLHRNSGCAEYGAGVQDDIRAMLSEMPWAAGGAAGNNEGLEDDEDSWGDEDDDEDLSEPDSDPSQHDQPFPRVARARLNLTALSQRYNLYFVAYQHEVHVFQPHRMGNILGRPALILRPSISRAAATVGGYQDTIFPHQMNHMVVGQLGNHEVLVMATDDGDVIAYYTFKIAKYVERYSSRSEHPPSEPHVAVPKQFFHENVGVSAWGLAVHQKSRLIAVSSNHHEVTVFAFALKDWKSRLNRPASLNAVTLELGSTIKNPKNIPGLDSEVIYQPPKDFSSRKRSWRIVLSLPRDASNIPSISFWNDRTGEAEKVAAVDISGVCWISDIWKIGSQPVRLMPHVVPDPDINLAFQNQPTRAWGVLVLHPSQFQVTRTIQECLGIGLHNLTLHENPSLGCWLDISRTLLDVKDNATLANSRQRFHMFLNELRPYLPVPSEAVWNHADPPQPAVWELASSGYADLCSANDDGSATVVDRADEISPLYEILEELQDFHLAMTMVPSTCSHYIEFTHDELLQFIGHKEAVERSEGTVAYGLNNAKNYFPIPPDTLQNISIFRTYEMAAELSSLETDSPGVVCHRLLEHHNPHNRPVVWDIAPNMAHRCSMLHFVPELCLVVVGSSCGRVALITLTEAPEGHYPRRGFRVEHLLPRQSDEELMLRPFVCLLGVAISPMPDLRTGGLDLLRPGTTPRRWRLILNYMDHTILTYDISRPDPGSDLELIF
ncbi:hypothetical protein NKR23_g7490 [Pleurostoma richardsiae]|uniref:Uncharacterized protein n=1 Tax=Pleurostoma richardsiae TaxID=41990 RepID=A0AA38RBT0_9PEZI|nr:hypothetical protein NKR23_g7490 [Pleurostoma richardsiae]